VRGLSFQVDEGEVFGLLGPNGAGKTTTLGVLTTLVRPTSGAAFVDGHDVVSDPFAARRSLGVVFQETVLDNDFSGAENMWLHARVWRVPDAAERIASLLAAVGLSDRADDGVMTYSGGMPAARDRARAPRSSARARPTTSRRSGLTRWSATSSGKWSASCEPPWGHGSGQHALPRGGGEGLRPRRDLGPWTITAQGRPQSLVEELGQAVLEVQTADDATLAVDALRAIGEPLQTGTTVSVPSHDAPGTLTERANTLGLADLGVTTMIVRPTTLNDVFLRLNGDRR